MDEWCGRRDLNPGLQAWKAYTMNDCVLTRLDHDRTGQDHHSEVKGKIINVLLKLQKNVNITQDEVNMEVWKWKVSLK